MRRIPASLRWAASLLTALLALNFKFAAWAAGTSGADTSFDADTNHLWNRLHAALFIRTTEDGRKFGAEELDPLVWSNSKFLLEEPSHGQALAVLDEFLEKHGEALIRDPLKRAFLQHDLWSLFDWSAGHDSAPGLVDQRQELEARLAATIRRLALTPAEIASLPNNYMLATTNKALPDLPGGLFDADPDWVCLGANGSDPVAPAHVAAFGGRSVFLVFLRHPQGRAAAIAYLRQLQDFKHPWAYRTNQFPNREFLDLNPDLPQFPTNTQWALVRRMCVIDTNGTAQATSITESIQVRRYLDIPRPVGDSSAMFQTLVNAQRMTAFQMDRQNSGALRAVTREEKQFEHFMVHGTDPFEFRPNGGAIRDPATFQARVLGTCSQCHAAAGVLSVNCLSRRFSGPAIELPQLTDSGAERDISLASVWKSRQYDWGLMQGLWRQLK